MFWRIAAALYGEFARIHFWAFFFVGAGVCANLSLGGLICRNEAADNAILAISVPLVQLKRYGCWIRVIVWSRRKASCRCCSVRNRHDGNSWPIRSAIRLASRLFIGIGKTQWPTSYMSRGLHFCPFLPLKDTSLIQDSCNPLTMPHSHYSVQTCLGCFRRPAKQSPEHHYFGEAITELSTVLCTYSTTSVESVHLRHCCR